MSTITTIMRPGTLLQLKQEAVGPLYFFEVNSIGSSIIETAGRSRAVEIKEGDIVMYVGEKYGFPGPFFDKESGVAIKYVILLAPNGKMFYDDVEKFYRFFKEEWKIIKTSAAQ